MLPSSLAAIFAFSFVIGLGAVVSPGPVSTAIVSQAPKKGWMAGPWIATGHSLMELLMVGLIGVGLTTILAHPAARLLIAFAGGVVLSWMGLQMLYQVVQSQIHLPTTQQTGMTLRSRQFVGLGVLTTVSNPFWYTWWVTVAAGYLAQAQSTGLAPIIAFYLGHISADYTWDTLLATAITSGRRWMNDRVYRSIFSLCGIFFLYLGGTFLRNGFTLLRNHPLL